MASLSSFIYTSEYPPGIQVDDGIRLFLERFYGLSDMPDAHEEYAACFTKDATLSMAGMKEARGYEEILQIRKGMWTAVSSRLHDPIKIFPFGSNSNEVMLYGTVAYVLKDSRKASIEWAARANLVKEGGSWKLGFYQVYLALSKTSPHSLKCSFPDVTK